MYKINYVNFIVMQTIIVISIIFLLIRLIKLLIANRYNKKFSAFVYSDVSTVDHSLEAKIASIIKSFIVANSFILNKLHLFKKRRQKYDCYLFINNYYLEQNIDFISVRILLNIIIILISSIFLLFSFSYYNLAIVLLFIILINFVIHIILIRYLRYYRKLLNKELLSVIRTINNSLSVGLNITQAINIAAKRCNPLLNQELELIVSDLNNGISIEKAFNRLYNRVKTDEILYLSSILSVLSKSGGSIQNTFEILEEDYDKKIKRQRSVNNLLLPYRFIFNFLGILPLIFFTYKLITINGLFIELFNSLYNTILIKLLIIYNVCYFIIVNNLMEVTKHE